MSKHLILVMFLLLLLISQALSQTPDFAYEKSKGKRTAAPNQNCQKDSYIHIFIRSKGFGMDQMCVYFNLGFPKTFFW